MSDPIRVLCVFASLGMGGAESLWMNIYRNLNRDRIQLDFVKHVDEEYPFEDEIRKLGGRVFKAPGYTVINYAKYKRWWYIFLKKHPEYRIVHGHYFTIANVYLSVARKLGRIAIAHSHANMNSVGNKWLKDFHTSRVEKNSDVHWACSKEAGDWLFPHGDYKVIKNGIEIERFRFDQEKRKMIREEFKLDNKYVIGTIGRFEVPKNPQGIIRIFESCLKCDPDVRLLWVGDGPEMLTVKRNLAENGLEKSVILTGVRKDVPDLLSAMDVFILPSNYEGLGIVLIEAQANGLHCFASDRVPEESNVTGHVEYLPIVEYAIWAERVLECENHRGEDPTEMLRKAEYDIKDVASEVQKMYLRFAGYYHREET